MDDLERARLARCHRDLMERAQQAVDEARRLRGECKDFSAAARLQSEALREAAKAAQSHIQDMRLWSQDVQPRTMETINVSQQSPLRLSRE